MCSLCGLRFDTAHPRTPLDEGHADAGQLSAASVTRVQDVNYRPEWAPLWPRIGLCLNQLNWEEVESRLPVHGGPIGAPMLLSFSRCRAIHAALPFLYDPWGGGNAKISCLMCSDPVKRSTAVLANGEPSTSGSGGKQ